MDILVKLANGNPDMGAGMLMLKQKGPPNWYGRQDRKTDKVDKTAKLSKSEKMAKPSGKRKNGTDVKTGGAENRSGRQKG